jgi:dTDP-glucose 4,6-dehydratase
MRLLVTGGLGFIGSNFIKYMMGKYQDCFIINLDKVTEVAGFDNLTSVEKNPNYVFVKGDISDYEIVTKVFTDYNPDYVVHLAAESSVTKSIEESKVFINSNVVGTHVLLEVCKIFDIKKVVVSDTDEVYGSIQKGFVNEEAVLAPTSPYSASKAASSLLALSYYYMYKLPVLTFRPSNNYGPYQYPEKVVPIFIINALLNKRLPIEGDGRHIRNWLYVEDNCKAIDLLLNKGRIGEIYNVSSDYECSIKELAEQILELLNKPKTLMTFREERLSDDYRYGIDSSKIRQLGWYPSTSFEEGLAKTVRWYKDNAYWWGNRYENANNKSK